MISRKPIATLLAFCILTLSATQLLAKSENETET